jgi:hypothetical protein
MDKKVKETITKEGLILLCVVAIGLILIQIGRNLVSNLDATGDTVALVGFWIIPGYIVIRIISSVIKKLSKK